MINESAKSALSASKAIQFEVLSYGGVPDAGTPAYSQQVVPKSLFQNTRGYIEKIVNQINGSYEKGWFDGCAVLLRRLLETLIIEAFENNQIADRIKNSSGDFYFLSDLIQATLNDTTWNLSRNSKKSIAKLKEVGDRSAHSRRFVARRWDIDKVIGDFRIVSEEIIYLAGLS